jgi:regulator of protease activity HflC (stomatin/prohibitin superfamily)
MKNYNKTIIALAVVIIIVAAVAISVVTTIPAGHTGVVTTFGKVSETVLQEGLHFKMPWQTVHKINNQITKLEVETEAFSKDLQTVSTVIAIQYRVDKSKSFSIYKEVGANYESILVTPTVNEVLKAITALYTAEESVTNRVNVSAGLLEGLNKKLNAIGIIVEDVNIINFDFSEAYISAIEEKQVAEQRLLKAQTEAEEKKVTAQAEADANLILAEAEAQAKAKARLIEAEAEAEAKTVVAEAEANANALIASSLDGNVIDYKTIEKWNGELPVATGTTPFIDISGAK